MKIQSSPPSIPMEMSGEVVPHNVFRSLKSSPESKTRSANFPKCKTFVINQIHIARKQQVKKTKQNKKILRSNN